MTLPLCKWMSLPVVVAVMAELLWQPHPLHPLDHLHPLHLASLMWVVAAWHQCLVLVLVGGLRAVLTVLLQQTAALKSIELQKLLWW